MTDPSPTLDHSGLEILSKDECLELLASEPVGRIAFIHEGAPVVLPVNHRVEGRTVVFRTDLGSKLSAAVMERVVAFEVDSYDAATQSGWSVLLRGTAESVDDTDAVAELDRLELTPWAAAGDRQHWVRVHPDEISGRRVHPEATDGG